MLTALTCQELGGEGKAEGWWKREWFARALAHPKPHVRCIILGHTDCGKSTLAGQLMVKLGAVSRGGACT
jgi:GTPase